MPHRWRRLAPLMFLQKAGPYGAAVIPSSGEKVPVIGLGTNRFSVGESAADRAPLRAVLQRFHELGGAVIDTAPMYRKSESVLGDLIADLGIRDELFIATKTDRTDGPAATIEQMRASMEKLKTDTIDLMQVHNLNGWKDALPVMREWQQEGRIRYIGITTSRSQQYAEFEEVMRNETLDFVQLNYSLEQREAAERLLPLAAERGIAVISTGLLVAAAFSRQLVSSSYRAGQEISVARAGRSFC